MTVIPVRVVVPFSTKVVDDIFDHALKSNVEAGVRKITLANGFE